MSVKVKVALRKKTIPSTNVEGIVHSECSPKFEQLKELYKCDECKFNKNRGHLSFFKPTCFGEARKIEHMGTCPKRFLWLWIIYIGATALLIPGFFLKLFTSGNSFGFSLLCTVIFAFVLDCICSFLENKTKEFLLFLEKQRFEKYNKLCKLKEEEKQIEKSKQEALEMKEKERNKKKEAIKETASNLQYIYNLLESILPKVNEEILDAFKTFLSNLNELIEMLEPEMLSEVYIRHFLEIHLKEFLKLSQRYSENVLGENHKNEYDFLELIKNMNARVLLYIEGINSDSTIDFEASVKALSKVVGNSNKKED